jgi:hypothetical protein
MQRDGPNCSINEVPVAVGGDSSSEVGVVAFVPVKPLITIWNADLQHSVRVAATAAGRASSGRDFIALPV